MRLRDSM